VSKIPFDTFLDDIMPELPGCPVDLAQRRIRRIVNSFGTETRYLTTMLPLIDVVAGQAPYSIVPPDTDLQLIRPEEVRYNGDEISPFGVDELNAELPSWRTETGEPRLYTRENSDEIILIYVPTVSVTDGLQVKISYAPDFNAVGGFEKVFYDRFADGIAAGVKADLMLMPKKPWSDQATAMKYEADYKLEVNRAKQLADRANSRAPRRTKSYYR
jgi:hypothetical protein